MRKAFIGVNRRRFGVPPGNLSALDGVKRNRTPYFEVKSRGPRRLKVGTAAIMQPPSGTLPLVSRRRRRRRRNGQTVLTNPGYQTASLGRTVLTNPGGLIDTRPKRYY